MSIALASHYSQGFCQWIFSHDFNPSWPVILLPRYFRILLDFAMQKKLRGVIAIAESDSVVSLTHRSQAKRFQNKTHLDIWFLGKIIVMKGSRVKMFFSRFLIYQKNHAYSSASCMDTTEFYMTPFFCDNFLSVSKKFMGGTSF